LEFDLENERETIRNYRRRVKRWRSASIRQMQGLRISTQSQELPYVNKPSFAKSLWPNS